MINKSTILSHVKVLELQPTLRESVDSQGGGGVHVDLDIVDVDVGVGADPDAHEVCVSSVVSGGPGDGEHRGQRQHVFSHLVSQVY